LKSEGNILSEANCLKTHGTECDNSAYNNSKKFSAGFARRLFVPPLVCIFKVACTKLGQMILKKIIKTAATRCYILG